MKLTWWTLNGVETKLPKGLVVRKSGGFDARYKKVKEFLVDKRWELHDPMGEFYAKKVIENMFKPNEILKSINYIKKGVDD